jgi:F420H(2)-dependent quinone reductase
VAKHGDGPAATPQGRQDDGLQIEVDGRKVPVSAEQLHGLERDQAWQQITNTAPRFAQYGQKTDRELPIIRLVARSS